MDDLDAIERFTGLYGRHRNRVYAYAVSRAGRQLADEVVYDIRTKEIASEVFLVAWRRLDALPDDPLPRLLVTARNVIGSQFHAAARQESRAAELSSWSSGVASDIADEVSERQTLLRALAALPEADRELLTLSAWHGLSPRDAASVVAGTGVSAAPEEVRTAILTAFSGVGGDVLYNKTTEIYSGKASKWNGVSLSWAYPLQPQAGQKAYVRYLVVPKNQKGDSELIWTEPSASMQGIPSKTKVIDVEYGNRAWSITSAPVSVGTVTGTCGPSASRSPTARSPWWGRPSSTARPWKN